MVLVNDEGKKCETNAMVIYFFNCKHYNVQVSGENKNYVDLKIKVGSLQ